MEFIAIIVGALIGWSQGSIHPNALKAIALIVLGWTTVTTIMGVPYIGVADVLYTLVFRALLIGVPYGGGILARRIALRVRRGR